MIDKPDDPGWSWFETSPPNDAKDDALVNAAIACFAGRNGDLVLQHLRSVYLDRRMPPSASDAELRHVEGQRSAIAYLLRLARPRG